MPSVDKAIINPFEPLGVGEALLVAVSGLLIVFVMLAMLMAVILVISKIVAAIEGKGKAPAAPAPKSAAPAAKPAAAPAAPAVDEGELVAVMMAAVAVLGFFFRLLGSRGVLVPLGFGLAFGRAGIRVFGFRSLAFLLAFVLGRRIGDALAPLQTL